MKSSLLIIFVVINCCFTTDEIYREELYIRPLATGETYFNLLFTTIVSTDLLQETPRRSFHFYSMNSLFYSFVVHHYYLFPKSIADVIRSNGVEEFHVSLTQGLWRYQRWGMPIVGAPPGAEVWAWFQQNHQQQ